MERRGEDKRSSDETRWKAEAEAVIKDVNRHVKDISVSIKLGVSKQSVYLNLTTLEELKYCIELSALGFSIVANEHDSNCLKGEQNRYFETPYSLLENVSQKYTQSFGSLLSIELEKLSHLKE